MSNSDIRLSATVLLLREGAQELEVFMVVRHHQIDFAAGALVFPGGKVAPGDSDVRAFERCTGIDGLTREQIALRIAVIREAFEECGVLLARSRKDALAIEPERLVELGSRYRRRLDRGEIGIFEMLEAEDLELRCEALVPFAHWITPTFMPKRFDTHFFLAVVPDEQRAVHDGIEMVDSAWLTPADAVREGEAGMRTIIPPTLLNLKKLGLSRSVDEALSAARKDSIVTVLPELILRNETSVRLKISADSGYPITEFSMSTV